MHVEHVNVSPDRFQQKLLFNKGITMLPICAGPTADILGQHQRIMRCHERCDTPHQPLQLQAPGRAYGPAVLLTVLHHQLSKCCRSDDRASQGRCTGHVMHTNHAHTLLILVYEHGPHHALAAVQSQLAPAEPLPLLHSLPNSGVRILMLPWAAITMQPSRAMFLQPSSEMLLQLLFES